MRERGEMVSLFCALDRVPGNLVVVPEEILGITSNGSPRQSLGM